MKGLNIKRIAALGLGAALVGSALAPAVMAAAYSNMDTLQKSNIVDSTGTPVVDIIVGSMGQAQDVVWAGNIAAKVAQLATTDVAGSGAKTVDITVGGTSTTSGAGETVDTALSTGQEFNIGVTNTKMPSLVNNTSFKYKWGSTTQQTGSVQESLMGGMNAFAQMETGSSRYAPGQLVASIAEGDLNYTVTLGTGLALATVAGQTGLDSNSQVDLTIPILGKSYTLDEVSSDKTKLVFYANTTPTDLAVGETVTVKGKAAYLGKDLTIKLVDLVQIGSGNQYYRAKWVLMDGTTQIKFVEKDTQSGSYNLKEEFGDLFSDTIFVTAAGLNLSANKYTATIRMGTDRLEIKNGYGFPYTGDSTVDTKAAWKASFSTTTLTSIVISNQWKYNKTIGSESDTSKYVLKVGESVKLPDDFAKFEFSGFQTKPMTEATLGSGELNYVDLKGTNITVPFYKQFDVESGKTKVVNISGKDYTFWLEDANFSYVEGDKSAAETQTAMGGTVVASSPETDLATVSLDLGARPYSGSTIDYIDYVLDVNLTTGTGFLLLKDQTFNVYSKNHTDSNIMFMGTQVDDNALNGVDDVAYYRPNMSEYLVDVQATTRSDHNYYAARFVFNDTTDVNMYVRADESGNVWNYNALADLDTTYAKFGPTLDATNAAWGSTAIRDGTDYLKAAATAYGTEVMSDNSVFTLNVPEEQRNVVAYLGSTGTSTTTTGGVKYTGVAAGETKGNVTVDAISGATAGKAIVPVGNIVKLDTDAAYGKSIIVGGFMVNKAAQNLQVDGKTLQERLVASGDYVSAVLTDGKIVVAGWTKDDTADAAKALIAALDKF